MKLKNMKDPVRPDAHIHVVKKDQIALSTVSMYTYPEHSVHVHVPRALCQHVVKEDLPLRNQAKYAQVDRQIYVANVSQKMG